MCRLWIIILLLHISASQGNSVAGPAEGADWSANQEVSSHSGNTQGSAGDNSGQPSPEQQQQWATDATPLVPPHTTTLLPNYTQENHVLPDPEKDALQDSSSGEDQPVTTPTPPVEPCPHTRRRRRTSSSGKIISGEDSRTLHARKKGLGSRDENVDEVLSALVRYADDPVLWRYVHTVVDELDSTKKAAGTTTTTAATPKRIYTINRAFIKRWKANFDRKRNASLSALKDAHGTPTPAPLPPPPHATIHPSSLREMQMSEHAATSGEHVHRARNGHGQHPKDRLTHHKKDGPYQHTHEGHGQHTKHGHGHHTQDGPVQHRKERPVQHTEEEEGPDQLPTDESFPIPKEGQILHTKDGFVRTFKGRTTRFRFRKVFNDEIDPQTGQPIRVPVLVISAVGDVIKTKVAPTEKPTEDAKSVPTRTYEDHSDTKNDLPDKMDTLTVVKDHTSESPASDENSTQTMNERRVFEADDSLQALNEIRQHKKLNKHTLRAKHLNTFEGQLEYLQRWHERLWRRILHKSLPRLPSP